MRPIYHYIIPVMWMLWVVYWKMASANSKKTIRKETLISRVKHISAIAVAVLLICLPSIPILGLNTRFMIAGTTGFWAGAATTLIGLLFAVWARVTLGVAWSGEVAIKQQHELVHRGPYSLVRHPIYSGFLLGFWVLQLRLGNGGAYWLWL